MKVQLDEIDRKLIPLLMEDASRTNVALARELGVSDNTVRNHMQRLLEEEVLQIVAIINPWKIGRRIQLISGLEVDLKYISEVANKLAQFPEVTYVSYTTGTFDLLMVSVFSDEEDLFNFLTKRVGNIDGIRRIASNHILKAVKQTFRYDQFLQKEESEQETIAK